MERTGFGLTLAGLACALMCAGCTIVTTTNDGSPPPKQRRKPRSHQAAPPPPPAAGRPAARPAPGQPPPRGNPNVATAPSRAPAARPAPNLLGPKGFSAKGPAPTLSPSLPAQPPKQDPPATRSRPQLLPDGVATGRPAGFRPGAVPAYWIWQGPRGGWRIRTTTKNAVHVFRGNIRGIPGSVASVQPSRNEFRDRIWKTRSGWAFSFATGGHADGFNFTTNGNGCVKFDLHLDGGPSAKRVFVGRSQHQPSSNHFIVCPKGKTPASIR